jgi:hypothetical protein
MDVAFALESRLLLGVGFGVLLVIHCDDPTFLIKHRAQ